MPLLRKKQTVNLPKEKSNAKSKLDISFLANPTATGIVAITAMIRRSCIAGCWQKQRGRLILGSGIIEAVKLPRIVRGNNKTGKGTKMKVTEKMAKIISDRTQNSIFSDIMSVGHDAQMWSISALIKKIEMLPFDSIAEVRRAIEEEEAKLQAFGEDSREYGDAFHNIQFLSSVIDITEANA